MKKKTFVEKNKIVKINKNGITVLPSALTIETDEKKNTIEQIKKEVDPNNNYE